MEQHAGKVTLASSELYWYKLQFVESLMGNILVCLDNEKGLFLCIELIREVPPDFVFE